MPPRHRDRRGRGLRGAVAPRGVPIRRSRADAFDDLVLDAVLHLQQRLPEQLRTVEFAVEDVPAGETGAGIALGASRPASATHPARIVIFRRPVETRAVGAQARADLVHDVVVEQVAELLGLEPETVDPDYGSD